MDNNLESLYKEAQTALKAKGYERASDLLRQILKADVDYKDAAQLLARVIKLSRRRWYNDPRLWGTLGTLLLIGLGIYFFPKFQGRYTQPAPTPVILPTGTPALTIAPPATATATATLLPTPTPIPLTWKRISLGQEFERDTVTAFATDKNDPDVIYAAMQNAGVYKTIDGGLSWQPAHQGMSNTQVKSLLIDSQNPQVLYAGTMGGVFKSEDGGEKWYKIGEGTYLLMDNQDNSHLYARDENGIYETHDQGENWTTAYVLKKDCPGTINSWAIHPTDSMMIFIGSEDECGPGVYQSEDGGRSWKSIGEASADPRPDKPGIFGLKALAVGLDSHGNYSVYTGNSISHDVGATWYSTEIFSCNTLIIDLDNPSAIYCAHESGGLLSIRGKGTTWQRITGVDSSRITTIHIDHVNGVERIIVGGSDRSKKMSTAIVGIFISNDGGLSWVQHDNGLGATRTEMKIDPLDSAIIYLAVSDSCGLYRSQDEGKSWLLIKSGWIGGGRVPSRYDSEDWCHPVFDPSHILYLNERAALQGSVDGGDTWFWEHIWERRGGQWISIWGELPYDLPSESEDGRSVSANPFIQGFLYDVGNVIYHSKNAGGDWQRSAGSEGLWDARLFYTDQSKLIYAIGRYHQAFSTDNGVTWQNCGEDVSTSQSDTRLVLDLQGSRLYLATPGQGVLISTDSCGSWQPSNEGLSNLFVNTLALDPNNPSIVYAGTDGGAYISYDAGATWGQVNDGLLGATVVYSIVVDKDSNVYAATPYGIFKLEGK